jgi:hypothetical protein
MSPLLEQVLENLEQLTPEEQLEVMNQAKQHLQRRETKTQKRKLSEFRGIAPNLLEGQDAQAWVNELRGEWDERERTVFEGL